MITIPYKLDWMTKEDYEAIRFHWRCVCDYEMEWANAEEYEAWCKRVLA